MASSTGAVCQVRPFQPQTVEHSPALGLGPVDEELAVEPQDVERDEGHRRVDEEPGRRLDDVHPALEALEARLALLVERHDLAIEHRRVRCQRLRHPGQLRVVAGDLAAPAVGDHDAVRTREDDDSLTI